MDREHSSRPRLCSKVFSRISSQVGVECHLVFSGDPPDMAAPSHSDAGHSLRGPLLISSTSQEQRIQPEELFPWSDQFWAFLSKENVSRFILSAVFISVLFTWICFIRELRTVGLMHEHALKYMRWVFLRGSLYIIKWNGYLWRGK